MMKESKAEAHRRMARLCLGLADRNVGADRVQLLIMGRRWEAMAVQAEADERKGYDESQTKACG